MDPNNNQPINTNPLGQPVPQAPAQPTQAVPEPIAANQSVPTPPKSNKKILILLLLLILLILGIVGYIIFAKNQLNNSQKAATENNSAVIPTATIEPTATPATVDQINIASPDADLKGIEKDVQGL